MDPETKDPVVPAAEPASTLDRALESLNAPEPPPAAPAAAPAAPAAPDPAKAAEPKPGDPAAPAAAKPGDAAKPAEPAGPFKVGEEAKFVISDKTLTTKEEIANLPYAEDATFKAIMGEFEQLAQFRVGMGEALNDGPYTIKDVPTLKATLADAFTLYDVVNLKSSPIELLELAAVNYGEENINQVIAQILVYAKEKGITAEMYSDLSKPENKKLFDLSKESRERKTNEATAQATERAKAEEKQKADDFTALETQVNKWAKDNKVADEDALDYLTFVIAQIGGDKKQLDAIRAGKYGEVERILTEYNNRMLDREKRWEDKATKRKTGREEKLGGAGAPAGGAPPPTEEKKKPLNFNDDEARLAAVREQLQK